MSPNDSPRILVGHANPDGTGRGNWSASVHPYEPDWTITEKMGFGTVDWSQYHPDNPGDLPPCATCGGSQPSAVHAVPGERVRDYWAERRFERVSWL